MTGYEERAARNDRSRLNAEHHFEPWDPDELDLLRLWSRSEDELGALAEMLGRTREACRQMFYYDRQRSLQGRSKSSARVIRTTVTRTTAEIVYNFCPICHLDPCCCCD